MKVGVNLLQCDSLRSRTSERTPCAEYGTQHFLQTPPRQPSAFLQALGCRCRHHVASFPLAASIASGQHPPISPNSAALRWNAKKKGALSSRRSAGRCHSHHPHASPMISHKFCSAIASLLCDWDPRTELLHLDRRVQKDICPHASTPLDLLERIGKAAEPCGRPPAGLLHPQ